MKVKAVAEQAIAEDGSDAIVLGCAGMADLTQWLSDELGVPVIDGVVAAVKLAEGLVSAGLQTSKAIGYATPRAKTYTGVLADYQPQGE